MKTVFLSLLVAAVASMIALTIASADGGNVGHANHFGPLNTWDANHQYTTYTCEYVHRTAVPGGFQDKQTCTLAPTAALPKKPTTVCLTDVGGSWYSDYMYVTANIVQYAQTWCETIMPSGKATMVSFYSAP